MLYTFPKHVILIFCVQVVQVSWLKYNRFTWKRIYIAIMVIYFWIFLIHEGINWWNFNKLEPWDKAKRLWDTVWWLFMVKHTVIIKYIINVLLWHIYICLIYILNNSHSKRPWNPDLFTWKNILQFSIIYKI